MPNTLYLSDLDGTLLPPDQKLTPYTVAAVNQFIQSGGFFSYATARSRVTAAQITAPLSLGLPAICYNGAFIYSAEGEICRAHFFTPQKQAQIEDALNRHGISPIVYAYVDSQERFSYIEDASNPGKAYHLSTRPGDARHRKVSTASELYKGDVFYISCIGTDEQLSVVRDLFAPDEQVQCIYQTDLYFEAIWCELLPAPATKAAAALRLKQMLDCDRLVVFGDGINDRSMFLAADESYAMANAVPELKAIATGVIGDNINDGVARFLHERL